jgi:hypothetical protein
MTLNPLSSDATISDGNGCSSSSASPLDLSLFFASSSASTVSKRKLIQNANFKFIF